VDVRDVVNGVADVQGWVHSRFLEREPADTQRSAAVETVVIG
jgi:hypothetical protein